MAEIEDILTDLAMKLLTTDNSVPYLTETDKSIITNAAKQIRQQQREFPDKALKNLLFDSDLWTPEELFWKIKCLIEGQPATTEEANDGHG